MKTLHSMIRELLHLPPKTLLTLFTVGVGIAVLILALSISDSFDKNITRELSAEGLVISVANAEYSEEGGLEPVRPGDFDEHAPEIIESELPGISAVSPIARTFWRDIQVGEDSYQIRRSYAVAPSYADIMDLEIISGTFFTDEDYAAGRKLAVLSESAAEDLFGGAAAAIGSTFSPPVRNIVILNQGSGPGDGGIRGMQRQEVAQSFEVVGVFSDTNEIKRKAYGIGDILIPLTTAVPSSRNISMALRFLMNTLVLKVEGASFKETESQLRSVLSREYGDDISLYVWEGEPEGESALLEETRQTVSTFSLVVNLLGFVLLLTGSIGILSIMIVEVLGKIRDISIERALGAGKSRIAVEFFTRSILLSAGSAVIGVVLGFIFARPLSLLLWPILSSVGVTIENSAVVSVRALIIGVASALLAGGVFGTLPVLSVFKIPIAEGIREN